MTRGRIWIIALLVAFPTLALTGCSRHAQPASAPELVKVPVMTCMTTRGLPRTGPARLGATSPFAIGPLDPTPYAYYTDDARQLTPVLAPRGWRCVAQVGADGGSDITVFPPGGSVTGPTTVSAEDEPACQGCVYGLVCAYLPQAGHQLAVNYLPCPAIKSGANAEHSVSSGYQAGTFNSVVQFYAGAAVHRLSGVLLYRWRRGQGGAAAQVTCRLPASKLSFCTPIVEDFQARSETAY